MSIIWTSFDASWKNWVMLGICVFFGIVVAVLLYFFEKFATFSIAGFWGFVVFE